MEGTSHEACSLAGHLKLNNLILFYDDNKITIEGSTSLAMSEDVAKRFEAYGWNVIRLKEEDMDKIHNYDIWFFALHDEIVESANNSSYDQNYLQQMLYYNYLNSMYGGYGYGGYGGYGYGYGGYGYGYDSYGYSNYYNMMLLNAMYSSSGNTSTTTATLDKDRYYKGILNGPDADRAPVLRVTYGIPRQ